jgi:hypothetical protein
VPLSVLSLSLSLSLCVCVCVCVCIVCAIRVCCPLFSAIQPFAYNLPAAGAAAFSATAAVPPIVIPPGKMSESTLSALETQQFTLVNSVVQYGTQYHA